jgi:hypothetical protein
MPCVARSGQFARPVVSTIRAVPLMAMPTTDFPCRMLAAGSWMLSAVREAASVKNVHAIGRTARLSRAAPGTA